MKLPIFNAPRAGHCTCLPKYNINTYLGRCAHQCIYCYAVKFPSFVGPVAPRLKLLNQIESMARNTKLKHPVMMSDCTDPYQPLEKEHKITRRCAEVLAKHGYPLLIVTKSDLVIRDLDVFKRTPTVVSVTITTLQEDISSLIEPYAPSPDRRISVIQKVAEQDIPAVARIDPIIPTINDDETDFEKLVSTLADMGVKQITIATMKPVRGFFSTLKQTNPSIGERLFRLYSDGRWVVGYKYLHEELRRGILEKLRPIILKHGLSFASCREGFAHLNTTLCDGTAYCRKMMDAYFR
ncbi:MAG: radical SAM protein [Candidatus Bathyarchaeaceae archaeon]